MVKRGLQVLAMIAAGGCIIQFGGCVSGFLAEVFYVVGPFLL